MNLLKKLCVCALALMTAMSVLAGTAAAADPSPASYGVDNLNNESGNLYIAYLGGSITEGAGADGVITYKDDAGRGSARWTSQLTKRYFKKKFPNKNVVEVNAGVGGTPSDLGLFRFRQEVVDKCNGEGPDVLFVEFAVNDKWVSNNSPVEAQKRMEGILRQAAKLPKQPVVIFVYTAAVDDGSFDNYLNSARVHDQVAKYYNIGSINLCKYVADGTDIYGNAIIWKRDTDGSWTGDGTHPNNEGYTQYTDYIIKQFNEHYDDFFKKIDLQRAPMSGYEFGKVSLLSQKSNRIIYTGGWRQENGLLQNAFLDGVRTSTTANSTLSFNFKGRTIGVYAPRGEKGATANYIIDKGSAHPITGTVSNYYPSGWMRVNTMLRFDLPPGDHTFTLTTNEMESGKQFSVGYFMLDEEQPDPIVADASLNHAGTVKAGTELEASYTYINPAEEGTSTFQWLESATRNGTYTPISGQTGKKLTVSDNVIGKYVKFRVTPVDCLGTAGEAVDSAPVQVVRPAASKAFSAKSVLYYDEADKLLSHIPAGALTAKTSVTNRMATAAVKVSMLTAEYTVDAQGVKTLVQVKKDTKEIAGGATVDFSNTLTAVAGEDHLVQTILVAEDNLEPIGQAAQLSGGQDEQVVYIGTENEDGTITSIYQINWFDDSGEADQLTYTGSEEKDGTLISSYEVNWFSKTLKKFSYLGTEMQQDGTSVSDYKINSFND